MKSWVVGATGNSPSTSANNHAALGGSGSEWRTGADDRVRTTWPLSSVSLDRLFVRVATAPGVGKSYVFEVFAAGVATGVTCTISGTNTTGSDLVNSFTPTAGDQMTLRSTPSGTPTATGRVMWNVRVNGGANQSIVMMHSTNIDSTTVSRKTVVQGSGYTDTRSQVMPCAGTFKNLYAKHSDPGVGNTRSIVLRVNGAESALTANLVSGSGNANDTTHTVTVAKGDEVDLYSKVTAGTPASGRWGCGMEFQPTTDGETPLMAANDTDYPGGTGYLAEGIDGSDATEANRNLHMPATQLKKLYFWLSVTPGSTHTRILKSRVGNANGNLTCTISNPNTTAEDSSNSDTLTDEALFDFQITETGTPNTAEAKTSLVMYDTTAATVTTKKLAALGVG